MLLKQRTVALLTLARKDPRGSKVEVDGLHQAV